MSPDTHTHTQRSFEKQQFQTVCAHLSPTLAAVHTIDAFPSHKRQYAASFFTQLFVLTWRAFVGFYRSKEMLVGMVCIFRVCFVCCV